MHHQDPSFATESTHEDGVDDPFMMMGHPPHGHEAMAFDDHAIDAGPFAHGAHEPAVGDHLAAPTTTGADHAEARPAWQLHVDHLSAHDINVDLGAHDHASHRNILSLAMETGWLGPSSPLMIFAGTVFSGAIGDRLRRFAAARTEELERRVERGERVVVAVDADELRRACRGDDQLAHLAGIPGQGVERAVELVGIEPAGSEGRTVVVDDKDGPLGRRAVPFSVFEAVWERSGRLAFTDDGARGGDADWPNEPSATRGAK
jgi:hypothetical protein